MESRSGPGLRRRVYLALEGGDALASAAFVRRFLVAVIAVSVAGVVLASVPEYRAQYALPLSLVEHAALFIFTVEYALRVWSAPEDVRMTGKSDMAARFLYIHSPMALIDLLAIAPIYVEEYLPEDFKILLTLRLLRFFKLVRYSPGMRSLIAAVEAERRALLASGVLLLGFIVMSAAAMYMVERNVQPDKFGTIPDAMWWAIVTLATVGYGDVVPTSLAGRLVAGFTMIAGMMMIALPIGVLVTSFSHEIHKREFVVTWEMVARVPLFATLDAPEIADVMRRLRAQTVPAGELITRRGDEADCMYFIAAGEVEVELDNETVRLTDGQFFGEVAVLRHTQRSANVRALRPTRLLILDERDLQRVMARKPDIGRRIEEIALKRVGPAAVGSDVLPEEIQNAS